MVPMSERNRSYYKKKYRSYKSYSYKINRRRFINCLKKPFHYRNLFIREWSFRVRANQSYERRLFTIFYEQSILLLLGS